MIGNELNQIAKKAIETGEVTAKAVEEVREQYARLENVFEKYLKPYLKYTKYEVDKNFEGKVVTYFPDGSLALISSSSIIFYPKASDYALNERDDGLFSRNADLSGTKYFTFFFAPNCKSCHTFEKGIEPYMYGWDGTKEMLLTNNSIGCKKEVSNERAYCTALIQMNGWKIPKDYPLRF